MEYTWILLLCGFEALELPGLFCLVDGESGICQRILTKAQRNVGCISMGITSSSRFYPFVARVSRLRLKQTRLVVPDPVRLYTLNASRRYSREYETFIKHSRTIRPHPIQVLTRNESTSCPMFLICVFTLISNYNSRKCNYIKLESIMRKIRRDQVINLANCGTIQVAF